MPFVYHSYVLACYPYVTRISSYVIGMSHICTRMSFVCHLYVLVCHPHVTCVYSYVIRMSLLCTCISPVWCYSYALVCHSYVTRVYSHVIRISFLCTRMLSICYSYVIRMSLVCSCMSSVCNSYVVLPWTFFLLCVLIYTFLLKPSCSPSWWFHHSDDNFLFWYIIEIHTFDNNLNDEEMITFHLICVETLMLQLLCYNFYVKLFYDINIMFDRKKIITEKP